jgi:hypothetical protein
MSYTTKDFRKKKELKDALSNGEVVTCYNPGLGPDLSNYSGVVYLEGPHYPKSHTWYAQGIMEHGRLVKVK